MLAVATVAALGSFRFDATRSLVELSGMSFTSFVSRVDPARSVFNREDFELIDHNRYIHA